MVIQQNMQKDFFLLPRFRYHSTANHSDFFNTHAWFSTEVKTQSVWAPSVLT